MGTDAKYRIEKDSLGELEVPAGVYYGANVARALVNFPISNRKVHPRIIDAYCWIKRAAAEVNMKAGRLPAEKAKAIEKAVPCERVGMSVIGLEVPHVHVHLIPLHSMADASFSKKEEVTKAQFEEIANEISRNFQL